MAKQTIVLTVQVKNGDDKFRTKAMKIVGGTAGVTLVHMEKDQENLTVEGEGVDAAALVQTLRKKVGKTDIFDISQVVPEE